VESSYSVDGVWHISFKGLIGGMYEVVIEIMRNDEMDRLHEVVEPLVRLNLRAIGAHA